jgi:inhibitor of cysteine peptidase
MKLYGGIAMRLKIFLVFTILASVLLLPACVVTSHDYTSEVSCDEFYADGNRSDEFTVEVGDKIRVELCSNPSTGFEWDYEMTVEDVLNEEDYDFQDPEGGAIGAAGTEMWTFEAIETGSTVVQMEYSQPWEGGMKAEWTYNISVTVE